MRWPLTSHLIWIYTICTGIDLGLPGWKSGSEIKSKIGADDIIFLYPATRLYRSIMVSHWLFVCPSICRMYVLLYFHLWLITWVNVNGIFTLLGTCIVIVKIWFGVANGQSLSIYISYLPATCLIFRFQTITWVNIYGFHQIWCVHWYCGDLFWYC